MNMLAESGRKACTRCGEVKPLEGYHRDNRRRDGRTSECSACRRSRDAIIYAENPDVARARAAAYRAANPAQNANRMRAYYAANLETERARGRAWHAENPHSAWEAYYRRRAQKYGFDPVVEHFTRDDLIARYGDACAHCGGPFEQLDHYPVPVSQGGAHTLENARPSCADCNRKSWQVAGDAQQAV